MRPHKQVHFSSTNTLYTFLAPTPEASPFFNTNRRLAKAEHDSLAHAKPSRVTPRAHVAKAPNHDHKRSHLRRLSLDSQLDTRRPVLLHFLLALSSDPYINYDVSSPPETLVCHFSSKILSEPATSPPLPIIVIDCPNCPWPITVTPSSSPPSSARGYGAVVTVWDVMSAIYFTLRPAITLDEYHTLPSLDAIQRVNAAYTKRCKRISDLEARIEEGLKGVRRVDFLGGMTRFMGLATHPIDGNIWKLVVSS